MSLCSYSIFLSLPKLATGSWHWVIAQQRGQRQLHSSVKPSGCEHFGCRLTVSKHQASWNMFLLFFPGRQWDVCSFRIVFREMLLVPVSAGTLKKWCVSKTHEKLLLWWGGDWSLTQIGDILRSRYALIENIPLILTIKHHFCYGAAAKHKVKLP